MDLRGLLLTAAYFLENAVFLVSTEGVGNLLRDFG